jgi:hypothetical protein
VKTINKPICGVYIITNTINGKFYIGKSIDIKRRWNQHRYTKTKTRFSNAIRKYGYKNFDFEILEEIKYDIFKKDELEAQLMLIEQKWLDEKRPYIKENGYNISTISQFNKTDQRDNDFKDKISKIKISMNSKGKAVVQYDLNGKYVKEWKSATEIERNLKIKAERISASCLHKQKKSHNYIWRFIGDVVTDEDIKNINKFRRPVKKVLQMDKNSNPIKIYDSMIEAASAVGSKISSPITHVCKGNNLTYKGFKWKYVDY